LRYKCVQIYIGLRLPTYVISDLATIFSIFLIGFWRHNRSCENF